MYRNNSGGGCRRGGGGRGGRGGSGFRTGQKPFFQIKDPGTDTGKGSENNNEESIYSDITNCPLCPNNCPIDSPACPRGVEYAAKLKPQEDRD